MSSQQLSSFDRLISILSSQFDYAETLAGVLHEQLVTKLKLTSKNTIEWLKQNIPTLKDIVQVLTINEKIALLQDLAALAAKAVSDSFSLFWKLFQNNLTEEIKKLAQTVKKEIVVIISSALASHYFIACKEKIIQGIKKFEDNEHMRKMADDHEFNIQTSNNFT